MDEPYDRAGAHEIYGIVVVPASRWRRLWAPVAIIAANLPVGGGGASNPGGRRFDIVDRASGTVLTSVHEQFADDVDVLGGLRGDLETRTAEDFRRRWIDD